MFTLCFVRHYFILDFWHWTLKDFVLRGCNHRWTLNMDTRSSIMWEVMVRLWKIVCHSQWNWSKYEGSEHPQLYTGTSFQILDAYQSHKEFSSQLCILYYFDSVVLMRMSSKGRLLQKWHCVRILDYKENDIMGRYHLQKDSGVSTVPFRMKRWIRYVYLDEPFHLFLWNSVVLFSVGFMSNFACITACAI